MTFLLSYDVSDDRLRTRLARLLERRGCRRLQKSVFLAPGFDPRETARLRTEILRLLQSKAGSADSLLCVPIDRDHITDLPWWATPDLICSLSDDPVKILI